MTLSHNFKICHVVNNLSGKADGVFAHLKAQIKNLDENFEHTVITSYDPKLKEILTENKINSEFLSDFSRNFSIKSLFELYKIIRYKNFDIINAHSIKALLFTSLLNLFLNKPLIFSYHGLFIKNDYNTFMEKIIYRLAFFVLLNIRKTIAIVPSQKSKELLLNETKLFKNISHYYNGEAVIELGVEEKSQLSNLINIIKKKDKLVAFVGRFDREKNVFRALRIFSRAMELYPNISLLLFGDGEYEEELNKTIRELNIRNVLVFGYVQNVSIYMKYFDCLLITSNREGLPIIVWEAMYYGLPVLSTDVGGIREIIENNKCGMVFNKNDEFEGVKKLVEILSNDELRKRMSMNGKVAITTKYTKDSFKDFFENLYLNLLYEKT